MNLKKILLLGGFVVFGGIGALSHPAYAKECVLNQSRFDLLVSSADSQNYFEKLRQELRLRKELVSNTITCAIEEASALKTGVDKLSDVETGKTVGLRISDLLDNALGYYKLQLGKVSDLGLEGSRYFAKDLLIWRKGNYGPIAKTASNFIMWSENQNLVRTAKNRLNQVGGAVTILKLIENESVQKKWDDVNRLFNIVLVENQNAKRGLENIDPPGETLTSIKLSLESLSEMYKTLSELVTEINALTSKIQRPGEK